jgi:hypothetical protein
MVKVSKAIHVRRCQQGYEILRITRCLDNRLINGGYIVSLTHRLRFIPQKHCNFFLWYLFLLEAD